MYTCIDDSNDDDSKAPFIYASTAGSAILVVVIMMAQFLWFVRIHTMIYNIDTFPAKADQSEARLNTPTTQHAIVNIKIKNRISKRI